MLRVIRSFSRESSLSPLTPRVRPTRDRPILSFQHPTQMERKYSPSVLIKNSTMWQDPQYNIILGMYMALCGYIVVMPDYPGMGSNFDVHPYCQNSLGNSVAGMIAKGRDTVQSNFTKIKSAVKWNR